MRLYHSLTCSKHIAPVLLAGVMLFCSCKTLQSTSSAPSNANTSTTTGTAATAGKYTGTVSHQYKKDGCSVVIIISSPSDKPITLIPKDPLPKELDVDGKEITFNYRPLKMPQPAGCSVGVPAVVTEVVRVK